MIRKKSEDAVSPVIGVMLMLVVTIIIAAVVAVFASGVGGEIEPVPTTVLDVIDFSKKDGVTLSCLHGDSLDLSKISIQVHFKGMKDGKYYTIEAPQNSKQGIFSPGDVNTFKLTKDTAVFRQFDGDMGMKADVIVYYNGHVIAEKEKITINT